MELEGRLDNPGVGEGKGGTPDAITAFQTNFLTGNSAEYREIDQAPWKDVTAVCVSDTAKKTDRRIHGDACRSWKTFDCCVYWLLEFRTFPVCIHIWINYAFSFFLVNKTHTMTFFVRADRVTLCPTVGWIIKYYLSVWLLLMIITIIVFVVLLILQSAAMVTSVIVVCYATFFWVKQTDHILLYTVWTQN